ncbi:hypothetical protein TCAL_16539 [Tigriopus californicus]|uniref:C-type lectin domain-containing protein n=1 Tax=Tigriopus californicus TaxID=6832 RepID=A0A553NT04_TIGCA|nr:hypothetical protein TCAL_16539 [Tigriopus californicus]
MTLIIFFAFETSSLPTTGAVLASTTGGSEDLWAGIYSPQHDWLKCVNESCHRYIYNIQGMPLSFYEWNVPIMADTSSMCLKLSPNGSISSQDCGQPLQAVCELDCSPRDSNGTTKSFEEANTHCQSLNANLVVVKSLRDNWGLNQLSKKQGGLKHEAYIGLDPSTLTQACSPWDGCRGLKWLDGTPYEKNAVHWVLTTNGSASVGCFVMKHFQDSNGDNYQIIGVNDCDQRRAYSCNDQQAGDFFKLDHDKTEKGVSPTAYCHDIKEFLDSILIDRGVAYHDGEYRASIDEGKDHRTCSCFIFKDSTFKFNVVNSTGVRMMHILAISPIKESYEAILSMLEKVDFHHFVPHDLEYFLSQDLKCLNMISLFLWETDSWNEKFVERSIASLDHNFKAFVKTDGDVM